MSLHGWETVPIAMVVLDVLRVSTRVVCVGRARRGGGNKGDSIELSRVHVLDAAVLR